MVASILLLSRIQTHISVSLYAVLVKFQTQNRPSSRDDLLCRWVSKQTKNLSDPCLEVLAVSLLLAEQSLQEIHEDNQQI